MKKLLLFSLLTLSIILSCQTNDETIPKQKVNSQLQQREIIGAGESDLDPTTHDDFDLEYEEGSNSSTSSIIFKYKLIKIVFASNTSEEQKNNLRNYFSINDLNGWELFYSEVCSTMPNVEFWSIRIDETKYIDKTTNNPITAIMDYVQNPPRANGPDDPIDSDPIEIECTAAEIKEKSIECL